MHLFRVPYVILHCSTMIFQFNLSTMHPFHALSSIVLQSLYMYEWSYNGKVVSFFLVALVDVLHPSSHQWCA
jgi:hypothetical protein